MTLVGLALRKHSNNSHLTKRVNVQRGRWFMTIINRELGFIYLKSRKTASSSVEIHLITNTVLGKDIYATSREILDYGWPRAQNHRVLFPGSSKVWYSPGRLERKTRSTIRGFDRMFPILSQHDSADKVRGMIGGQFFDKAIKAVPVRNPWDALVSLYEWQRSGGQGRKQPLDLSWDDWFNEKVLNVSSDQPSPAEKVLFFDHINLGAEAMNAEFIYFEDISGSLRTIAERLGLSASALGTLDIRLKVGKRSRDYRTYYSDDQAGQVHDVFKTFIQRTGYSYNYPK